MTPSSPGHLAATPVMPVGPVGPVAPLIDRDHRFLPAGAAGLAARGWRLRRAWPRDAGHLLLDLLDPDGIQVAGQWLADPARAAHIAGRTPGSRLVGGSSDAGSRSAASGGGATSGGGAAHGAGAAGDDGAVVLQPGGADRRLRPLAGLVRRDGFTLVGHRPEKRAVLAGPGCFVKVLRPDRLEDAASRARSVAGMNIGAPAVLEVDEARGLLVTKALPGRPLTALLAAADDGPDGIDRAGQACRLAGEALARLHARPVPDHGLPLHGPAQEIAVLERWQRQVAAHVPGMYPGQAVLPDLPTPSRRTLLHRDLHDGQLLVDGDRVGIIDCDLLAVGDPALDLANLLVHLELRGQQGVFGRAGTTPEQSGTVPTVRDLQAAVLEGYRPGGDVRDALPAYARAARMRLRAVYALRDPDLVS
jgi:hypothetical protein